MANDEVIKVYTNYIPLEDLKFDPNACKEPDPEYELDEYDKYLLDLYEFLSEYYKGWTLTDFYNSPIDDIYYLKEKYIKKLNVDPTELKALPLDVSHWALIRTLMTVFKKKSR
jgi:hypothetical protein